MKKTLLIVLTFYSFAITAQTNQQTLIDSVYTKYFNLSKEIPYLQLNKTSFSKGEEIWFKAYILNFNTQKLHKKTSNLYCYLYNEKGILKEKQLLYVKDGLASGSFKIDSTFTNENYYIKATTNYMQNFNEDESFVQKITVLNNYTQLQPKTKNTIDFQLLPEGGYLIANTINSLGIIVKDSLNRGMSIKKGEILENDNVIASFNTNQFGFSKVKVFLQPSKIYTSKVTLDNGSIIEKKLPNIKQKGISLTVNNPNTNITEFTFSTNEVTLPELLGKNYYFLIHNGNHYLKRQINFKKNVSTFSLIINNNKLPSGTNIITLFNHRNQAIAERVFFNYDKNTLFTTVNTKVEQNNDNSTLVLNKEEKDSESYYLSASILPSETKSYSPSNTIFTKFLITPYIKGNIEQPSYYFKNINRKKLYNLDLLLLNQGWSKYNWHDIFNNSPNENYKHDKGITIQGTINSKIPKNSNQILLVSKENGIFNSQPLNNKTFTFKNLFLKNGSDFHLALLKPNKKMEELKAYIRYPNLPMSTSNFLPKVDFPNKSLISKPISYTNDNLQSFISKDFDVLDEVIIKKKLITFDHLPSRTTFLSLLDRVKVKNSRYKNMSLVNFLRFRGFRINELFGNVIISSNRSVSNLAGKKPPTKVFLNENIIQTPSINNLDIISETFLDDYDEIYITHAFGGEIHLFTSTEFNNTNKSKNLYSNFKAPIGYSPKKEYYQPKYSNTQSDLFKEYGAIFWEPNILINQKNKKLTFKNYDLEKVKLLIEGITDSGRLIRFEKIITLKKNKQI